MGSVEYSDVASFNLMVCITQLPAYPFRKKSGDTHRENSTWFQYPVYLDHNCLVVRNMLQDLGADYLVKCMPGKRQLATIGHGYHQAFFLVVRVREFTESLFCDLKILDGKIDPHGLHILVHIGRNRVTTFAATKIQDAIIITQPHMFEVNRL